MKETILFRKFLNTAFVGGLYSNDDLIAFVLNLFRETATAHDEGMIAPFGQTDALIVLNGCLTFDHNGFQQPVKNDAVVKIGPGPLPAGYAGIEIPSGIHDALSDIYCLGLILGSMAMGLDMYHEKDRNTFNQYRHNPSHINNRLHPVICSLITEMTEPDRNLRLQ